MKARLLLAILATLCASLALAAPSMADSDPQANNLGYQEPGFNTVKVYGTVADGTCNPNPCDVSYHFEYGKTTALGTSTPTKTVITNSQVFEDLTNLDPGTKYYFTLVVESGGKTHTGGPIEFTTKTHVPPTATTNDATNVTWFDAKVNGTVGNGATGYFFEWGTNQNALTQLTSERNYATNVNETLGNLAESTTYYFRVVAKKSGEADVRGEIKSFTTQLSPGNRDNDSDGFKNSDDICPDQAGPAAGPYNQRGCPAPPDEDGDGVPDYQDSCKGVKGLKDGGYPGAGCPPPPDSDGDGYPDMQDACPNEKGDEGHVGESNRGCPRVDRDGDGYFDSEDGCGEAGGPAIPENGNKQGCPVDDRDGDAVADIHDKCPDVGHGQTFTESDEEDVIPVEPNGCPKLEVRAYGGTVIASWKDFLKKGANANYICGWKGHTNLQKCSVKATLAFDGATAKKLKLSSAVIDMVSDSSPGPGKKGGVCTACYMFNRFEAPAALKKKVKSLSKGAFVVTVVLTDPRLGTKTTWRTTVELGDKKDPPKLKQV